MWENRNLTVIDGINKKQISGQKLVKRMMEASLKSKAVDLYWRGG